MLENAYYSVISPEMCATILHKDARRASETSACLQLTAEDLVRLGLADAVVAEPRGGAHRDPEMVFSGVREALSAALDALSAVDRATLPDTRYERLRRIGELAGA